MSQFVVGVSGGIGSGKTTVTDLFAKYGVEVIDADIIARQVVELGSTALHTIVEKFGDIILNKNGQLDRAKLRTLVFQDTQSKNWLNQLLHPAIRDRMLLQVQQAKSVYCLLSVPLLVENKLTTTVDRVLIVDVSQALQLERTVQRDNSDAQQIRAIMQSQVSREKRLSVADDIIDNNSNLQALEKQVRTLHTEYLRLAKIKS